MKSIINILIISSVLFLTGCFSAVIGVNTVQPYEKRYTKLDVISVNGTNICIPENKNVWILTDDTLEVLLSTAADKKLNSVKTIKK